MEQWRKQQEAKFRAMVDQLSSEVEHKTGYPLPHGWLRWATDYFCGRFKYLEKPNDWIATLAKMDDDVLLYHPEWETGNKYLKRIRDYARRYIK